jgi:predicted ATPase
MASVRRETELEESATLVRQHRLVALTGTGGVGKTQTALQVGSALGDTTDGAACFVGLAPIGDPSFGVYATRRRLAYGRRQINLRCRCCSPISRARRSC